MGAGLAMTIYGLNIDWSLPQFRLGQLAVGSFNGSVIILVCLYSQRNLYIADW